jgi:hypothetical protein
MNRETIDKLVHKAIDFLVKYEPQLLDLNVTERALSHHLARYLGELFPKGYNVDCEYNRQFKDPKRLKLKPPKAKDNEIRATTVFPDIIIHKRDSDKDKDNLLVLEMKKPRESLDYDKEKLLAFRKELKYDHTAHVILGRQNGKLVKKIIWVDG